MQHVDLETSQQALGEAGKPSTHGYLDDPVGLGLAASLPAGYSATIEVEAGIEQPQHFERPHLAAAAAASRKHEVRVAMPGMDMLASSPSRAAR